MAQNYSTGQEQAIRPHASESTELARVPLEQATRSSEPACNLPGERRRDGNRRQSSIGAFVYGNFRPRRRMSRRASDAHVFLFDWHEPRVFYLALCILLLSCTDALFTLNLLTAGASEANVVMASLLGKGIDVFLVGKLGLTAFSLFILAVAARRKFYGPVNVEHLLKALCICYILVIYYEIYLFRFVFDLQILPYI